MRARSVKPGFFKNEILGAADPIYSLVFEGLWCLADREGRLEDRPLRIHAEINPYRPGASTVQALDWLCASRFLVRYESGGEKYLAIVNFRKHQQPHIKEAPSKIPPPPNQEVAQAPDEHGASTEVAALTPDSPFPIPDSPFPSKTRARKAAADVPRETTNDEAAEHVAMLKAKWPRGAARENWIGAERAARRIVDDGLATWDDVHAGVERYARLAKATGRVVMNPVNFFTAEDRPWSQLWPLPATKAEAAQSANVDAALTWLEQNHAAN